MSHKWHAPIDVPSAQDQDLALLVRDASGWQPTVGHGSTVRAQWLLWQAWRLGRWNELEHGFRRPEFDPNVVFVPCASLGPAASPTSSPTLNPVVLPHLPQHGWPFWLNVHPTPPNVWNAYQTAGGRWAVPHPMDAGPTDLTNAPEHALSVLWSRWWYHARSSLAFEEMLRRLEQGRAVGWHLHAHAGLDKSLVQGWQKVDEAREAQGRFAPLCRRFADLAARLQAWGVAWDQPMDDVDQPPRLWSLIRDQWMFLHPADVERDGWLGRLLVNDPNLWDGPRGLRPCWETAYQQEGPLLSREEDVQGMAEVWATVQRVGEGARLRTLTAGQGTSGERTRRRL